jgi:hypothetical protein
MFRLTTIRGVQGCMNRICAIHTVHWRRHRYWLPDASRPLDWPHVVINNLRFEVIQKVSRSVDFFFANCPLSHLVYQFLADDLKRQYQMALGRFLF